MDRVDVLPSRYHCSHETINKQTRQTFCTTTYTSSGVNHDDSKKSIERVFSKLKIAKLFSNQ